MLQAKYEMHISGLDLYHQRKIKVDVGMGSSSVVRYFRIVGLHLGTPLWRCGHRVGINCRRDRVVLALGLGRQARTTVKIGLKLRPPRRSCQRIGTAPKIGFGTAARARPTQRVGTASKFPSSVCH
ncbi:hypothetical protein L484_007988 [Morus notabilis]|uniref:Uncharacterized protein n=1 Tax=Morus notabilis TaxID=981085 RepID=W9R752_9ROSA|nr:hypothetical protein L484_007988 [Morus notabilis]